MHMVKIAGILLSITVAVVLLSMGGKDDDSKEFKRQIAKGTKFESVKKK